ncbi:putative quinate permease [Hypsizygus marmoreus]|uniref:Quinate permease n=1 Tax=Hypsizygus marmoreus TaxID=39966 RepID=A0A369JGE9_HYPMA|nr:putative quinate permease [Hypsizygus marmoreus]
MGAPIGLFKNLHVYYLAFIVYWEIILFGYVTGIAGGVVSQVYFQNHFGLTNDGMKNVKRTNDVSFIIVCVFRSGAFFGALKVLPPRVRDAFLCCSLPRFLNPLRFLAKIGRKWALVAFMSILSIGAILTTIANDKHNGLQLIHAGRVIFGFGTGGISAVAPAYVSECSPKDVRGRIMGLFQIMVAVGVVISYFINYGVNEHIKTGANVWRILFGFQLVPAGIMLLGLFTVKESLRWLASVGRSREAVANLAHLRKPPETSESILYKVAEIEAALEEERIARADLGLKEAFLSKGNSIRFVIAFVMFLLRQWGGQNSVGYYAPQIFASIGYSGAKNSLLASGIYGVVKVASSLDVSITVSTDNRSLPPSSSSFWCRVSGSQDVAHHFVLSVWASHSSSSVLSSRPVRLSSATLRLRHPRLWPPCCTSTYASTRWAGVLYHGCMSPTFSRPGHGITDCRWRALRSGFEISSCLRSPDIISNLGYKIFMFATVNIGRSLEDMDLVFGSTSAEEHRANIEQQENANERIKNDSTFLNSVRDEKV